MKILQNKIFLYIALCSYLKPSGFENGGLSGINSIFNVLRIICALIILLEYISMHYKCSKFVFFEAFYFGIMLFSYYVNDTDFNEIKRFVILAVSVITLTMLIDYYCAKRDVWDILKALLIVYSICLWINLILVMINYGWSIGRMDDLYVSYSFLASDNSTAGYIFPALLIIALYCSRNEKKYTSILVLDFLCIILTLIRMWSATMLIGGICFIFYYLFVYNNKIERIFNIKWLILIDIILIIGISFFGIQKWFSYLIVQVLNKSVAMTGRTTLWSRGLTDFLSSPIIGCGAEPQKYYIDSTFIQTMRRGGLITLLFLLLMIGLVYIRLVKYQQNSKVKLCCIMLFLVLIMSITETWTKFIGLYVILAICYNCKSLTVYDSSSRMKIIFAYKDKKITVLGG